MSQGPQGQAGPEVGFGFAVSATVRGAPTIGEEDMPEVEERLLADVTRQLREFVRDTVKLRHAEGAAEARVDFCAIPMETMIKLKGGVK